MSDHRAIAAVELERCETIARMRWGFDQPIVVRWDLRGLTAGVARHVGYIVRFNEHIAKAEGEAYAQTVAHEVAHLVVAWRYKRAYDTWRASGDSTAGRSYPRRPRSHGLEWASVMAAFGKPAHRCHAYESAERAVERRVYAYTCERCARPFKLGAQRHAKAQRGVAYRHARGCGGRLIAVA
jgi:predicted SprT family Zn-dependent metalloprotease